MDNQHTSQQYTPSVEDTAHQTADSLLMDAVDAIGVIIPPHVDSPAVAILIAAHAIIAKLDSIETMFLQALHCPDDANEVPTDEERVVIYRALEADYMARGNSPSIKEMDAALLHFKKLAGL